MRKWQDLAAPDDPGSWSAVSNMVPTHRGSYEAGPSTSSFTVTATGTGDVVYAFAGKTLSSVREYIVDNSGHIWEYSSGTLTDRTGGVSPGLDAMMAQYGDVTIGVMGTSFATVKSTGGNFSALSGAPKGRIICTQSNAVLIFNTDTSADGWATSDVGDYTNWTTGEAASGRIIDIPGPITAAVPFGNDVIVFKADAIYRMTYVGGVIKWQIQLVWKGLGCALSRFNACATSKGVAFNGKILAVTQQDGTVHQDVYLFDGVSQPRLINPLTTVSYGTSGQDSVYVYAAQANTLCIAPAYGSNASGQDGNAATSRYFYYNLQTEMWGAGNGGSGEGTTTGNGVLQGSLQDTQSNTSSRPGFWTKSAANTLKRSGPGSTAATCYLQTTKVGDSSKKTKFTRLIERLRRRVDGGSGSTSLSFELFRQLEDTSAQNTQTVSQSAPSNSPRCFDLLGGASTDNFGRFKVTWTNFDIEVDDFDIQVEKAGKA